ncbi:uncharacterized protein GGS22DRAFT_192178 [Annulohypoxylon maeteangense]|uniref:uncharacterized protein n=1 Tax=Annulohypoxylon maeteangense TaxID=1927788 RepID=UPI0020080A91|nr:uncharacterized protein GGS22DRAFT_192178 [Annulohypoxylon maeteangense]KAI0881544.1 hypothetical protein GGS22DRAFT_192178 [Annulohypoxylon maeteangense]
MAPRPVTDRDTGIKILYEPDKIDLDIVFIHGIGAHPDDTWGKRTGSAEEPVFINWLSHPDMLPAAVPNARIMRYGYKSNWYGANAIQQNVLRVGDRFLRSLSRKREDSSCKKRPLLIGAHCFGGLVALAGVIQAERDRKRWPNIYENVTGMLLFGTPFRGTEEASQMKMLLTAQSMYKGTIHEDILGVTYRNDALLMQIVRDFEKIRGRDNDTIMVTCFYELIPVDVMMILSLEGELSLMVDQTSGCLDRAEIVGLERSHFDLNKFDAPDEEEYETVLDEIRRMVKAAPGLLTAKYQDVINHPDSENGQSEVLDDHSMGELDPWGVHELSTGEPNGRLQDQTAEHVRGPNVDVNQRRIPGTSSQPMKLPSGMNMPRTRSWVIKRHQSVYSIEYDESNDWLGALTGLLQKMRHLDF